MKKKRGKAEVLDAPAVDMSSLVDISFLLLIFFLVTTTLLAKEQDMPTTVPRDGLPTERAPVTIRIESDNRVILHPGQSFQEEVASETEGHRLSRLAERLALLNDSGQIIQLDVADGAGYQRFMDVLDCLRGEGLEKIAITQH